MLIVIKNVKKKKKKKNVNSEGPLLCSALVLFKQGLSYFKDKKDKDFKSNKTDMDH
jgi:hypothetical protein